MSHHKNPMYQIPELIQALKDHHLPTDKPSQLADSFRDGRMAAMRSAPKSKVEPGGVAVAVDHNYEYQFMDTCPKGAQVWLCTEYGVGIPGTWNGKDPQFIGWAPKPKIPKLMKKLMKWAKP